MKTELNCTDRATNNPIHLWVAFPNLNLFGVCHFGEVENRGKLGLLNTPPFFTYHQIGVKTCFLYLVHDLGLLCNVFRVPIK